MTTLIETIRRRIPSGGVAAAEASVPGTGVRLAAVAALAVIALAIPGGVETAGHAIADAYLAVTVFVAGTIAVLYAVEGAFKTDIGQALMRHRGYQVPAGAVLGALPGCGGAIVAVTQFTRGSMSFGGVVATLTSTMGDAMFLLIAREPSTALLVAGVGIVAGIVTGYGVDAVHGQRFMQPDTPATDSAARFVWSDGSITATEKAWYALLVPGIAFGVMAA
ncbi:MAG: putative manganese transporter, partial [Gammaproteobacteria bacterium]